MPQTTLWGCTTLMCSIVWLLFQTALSVLPNPSYALSASGGDRSVCDRVAMEAARKTGVPYDVLSAITRTETGRQGGDGFAPWPWTVNMEGVGQWFATKNEALAYVFANFKRGARSFDVGCFQINYRWHGDAFRSIEDMFDPELNANYAAEFLAQLFDETGDWTKAAGAYHSRTPEFANRYEARFERIRQSIGLERSVPQQRASFGPPKALSLGAQLGQGPLIALSADPQRTALRGSLMPPPEMLANLRGALVQLD